MDAFAALSDRRADAEEERALLAPLAQGAGAVYLAGEDHGGRAQPRPPLGLLRLIKRCPRVGRCCDQPWALGRNAVGVPDRGRHPPGRAPTSLRAPLHSAAHLPFGGLAAH